MVLNTLSNPGDYTVFAPNNDAFTALLATLTPDEQAALLADENGQLTNILLYHVLPFEIFSTGIPLGTTFVDTLLPGAQVRVENDGTNIFVNNNRVILADVDATNGVVHVVDGVLLPLEVAVPNLGEIAIGAGAAVPALNTPAGSQVFLSNGAPLQLPQDADGNGFDTFIITEFRTVADIEYYGIFIGGRNYVYVRANQVTRIR